MDINGKVWRGLFRGLRTGDPGLIVGAGTLGMILWLRRHPPQRELLGSYTLKEGEAVTVRLRDRDEV